MHSGIDLMINFARYWWSEKSGVHVTYENINLLCSVNFKAEKDNYKIYVRSRMRIQRACGAQTPV